MNLDPRSRPRRADDGIPNVSDIWQSLRTRVTYPSRGSSLRTLMIEKMHFRNQIRRRLGTMKRRTANRGVLSIGLVSLLVGLGGETLSWGADPAGPPENTSQISFPLGIESARSVLERVAAASSSSRWFRRVRAAESPGRGWGGIIRAPLVMTGNGLPIAVMSTRPARLLPEVHRAARILPAA